MKTLEQEKLIWDHLKQLADDDKVIEFYQEYAKYLEESNVISNSRKAIYKMAKRVVEILNETNYGRGFP